MRIVVFWDVMQCMLAYHCCGRDVCYCHLQGMLLLHRLSCFDLCIVYCTAWYGSDSAYPDVLTVLEIFSLVPFNTIYQYTSDTFQHCAALSSHLIIMQISSCISIILLKVICIYEERWLYIVVWFLSEFDKFLCSAVKYVFNMFNTFSSFVLRIFVCERVPFQQVNNIMSTFQDRLRIPWRGGAKQISIDSALPLVLLPMLVYVAAQSVWCTLLVLLIMLLSLCYLYSVFMRFLPRTKFFFVWTLTSAVLLLLIFELSVVPFLEIMPQENCVLIALVISAGLCLYKVCKVSVYFI